MNPFTSRHPAYPGTTRRPGRRLLIVSLVSLAVICLAGFALYGAVAYLNTSPGKVGVYRIEIAPGMTARQVGEHLEREGLIRSSLYFRILARVKRFDRQIHAGEHWVGGSESTLTILGQLLSGGVCVTRVTVPEGLTLRQMGDVIAETMTFTADEFYAATTDSAVVERYGWTGASTLEGFLFPDTYHFDARTGVDGVIGTMARRFGDMFTPEMQARADSLGMTVREVITLASIVEKEAMVEDERPVISQVFHKRLKLGYKLGADPTVKYALQRNHHRLSLRDIKVDSPYNTYLYDGLPPGPICSPGMRSIRATLSPADTDYLYFVANWDGTHTFTRTLREHNAAKRISTRKYKEWRREQRSRSGS